MRILYGVSGEGYGHSSRALAIAKHLEKKGHEVIILTSGLAYRVLKGDFKIFKIKGMRLIFRKSILKKRKTFIYNLKNFPKDLKKWRKFHQLMKCFNPDLCITDMEPTATILSHLYHRPLISLDNEHSITNLRLSIPRNEFRAYFVAKTVVGAFAKGAGHFIIISFTDADVKEKNKKKTSVVPPIIRPEIRNLHPRSGKRVLVYLTKKDAHVLSILKKIPEKFVVYGYNIIKNNRNLEFKKRQTFLQDLEDCKAIIATAGFSLMSEAVFLNKPYLAMPLKGHFEQLSNALFLKDAGFGDYSEKLSEKQVIGFLKKLEEYKKNLKKYAPDHDALYEVLDKALEKIVKRK